jgi:CheY-like chemotaxis protein
MSSDFDLMRSHKHFLCIDADADGRLLFVRILMRVFPQAAIVEVKDYNTALNLVATHSFDAIVAHRAIGADTTTLIGGLRGAAAEIPILAVSSKGRPQELLAAGATRFLPYDSWLLVGTTVAEMLADKCPHQV